MTVKWAPPAPKSSYPEAYHLYTLHQELYQHQVNNINIHLPLSMCIYMSPFDPYKEHPVLHQAIHTAFALIDSLQRRLFWELRILNTFSYWFIIGSEREMMWNENVLEQPTLPLSGDSRYLTPLWVSANVERPCQSDLTQSVTIGSEVQADSSYRQEIQCTIRAVLKLLFFREQHVLVQFWSPHYDGKHLLLTTIDQPFGVGVANEQLCIYRKASEQNAFRLDTDHEENVNPPVRAFMRGLPEWTCDLTNYNKKDFPLLDSAIRCNLHGYLALPVFDLTKRLCIRNLTSPQVFDGPALNVFNERRKKELDEIYDILKHVCDTHNLPLAQTWMVSPSASCFAHEKVLVKSCSSFNTRCFSKVCMSTALPFYVRDLSTWPFMEASKECHLEISRGVAGRAFSSHGSCFCGDVTRLDEEEYPLVHNARMSGLTSCFAIFLHCVEGNSDYVLEFFLKDSRHVLNMVQTIKHSVKVPSGFELGDGSSIEVVDPPMDLSVNMTNTSGLESIITDNSDPDYANVTDHWPSTDDGLEEISDNFTVTDLP
ncbi:hypothetical protein E3N88_17266 [Mikania micrantha]|uniref:NLP1-9 GAF domain-containing protein n=1 Tax=Mikania micrantha TaxID=192012 RepID=A0A5N6NSV5_9ASTR|nr:hypothetical protein E3N88_17266 [Mikania micrantha]